MVSYVHVSHYCHVRVLVRHGLVYLECDAEGQWSKQRNASECVSRDPSQINMVRDTNSY